MIETDRKEKEKRNITSETSEGLTISTLVVYIIHSHICYICVGHDRRLFASISVHRYCLNYV